MSVSWDDYLAQERSWILGRLNAGFEIKIAPPPTRAETIQEAWRMVGRDWQRDSIDGRLIVCCDLGIVEPILFEAIRYGEQWVIEAEGVVVEKVAIR